MYYNPETQEQITYTLLKNKFNASISLNAEEYNGWYLLHEGERPEETYNTRIVKGNITEVEGKYYQTYSLEELLPSALQVKTRVERNRLLTNYVDSQVNNILKWNDLSSEEQNIISSYRRYLLDYPQSLEEWYKEKPLELEEWKIKIYNVEEVI